MRFIILALSILVSVLAKDEPGCQDRSSPARKIMVEALSNDDCEEKCLNTLDCKSFQFRKFKCVLYIAGSESKQEVNKGVKCNDGWIGNPITGSCFMIVREAMDWKTARNKCRSFGFGSQLAKIRCSLDNRFVKDVLAKDTLKNVGYWMGGTDFYHAGNWVWTDGSPVSCFTDWHEGEPFGSWNGKNEDCLAWWRSKNWEWNDVNCETKIPAVCMIPVKKCEEGWTLNPTSGTCYIILSKKQDWKTARQNCAMLNSELISLRTSQEYLFVKDFLNPSDEENFWIGGNVDNTGSWVWSSNKSPISLAAYSNWSSGQPSYSKNENCLKLRRSNMEWFGANCGRELPAVCKKHSSKSLKV